MSIKYRLEYLEGFALLAGLFLFAWSEPAEAAILLDTPITWDSGLAGWSSQSAGAVGAVANGGGNLNMNFPGVVGVPTMQSDAMITGNLNDDYSAYQYLQVAFNFRGYASSAQSLYFSSLAGGGSTWTYDFTIPDSSWHNYAVSLNNSAGWIRQSGAGSFALALTSVDLIGINIGHLNSGAPLVYTLDDWTYTNNVPEPGSVSMVFAALGSFGIVCRFRRRKGSAVPGQVK